MPRASSPSCGSERVAPGAGCTVGILARNCRGASPALEAAGNRSHGGCLAPLCVASIEHMKNIEARLAKLEAQSRTWRRLAIFSLVAPIAVLLLAFVQGQGQDKAEFKSLKVGKLEAESITAFYLGFEKRAGYT